MSGERTELFDLFDIHGQRKYLNSAEARRFLAVLPALGNAERLFCLVLFYTGCRISEALELTPRRLDTDDKRIIFRTLKRRKLVYRAVPAPARLIRDLTALGHTLEAATPLFPWCRVTGWRIVKEVMERARIAGPQASPKGLRHAFGIHAIEVRIPEPMLQRWMGHARARTTRIYTVFDGTDERRWAKRMW
ncbi:MAG: site-specific integrase [Sphingomonas sp.]|jgi:integrase